MSKLITPKTRLTEIFENFPGLEARIIELVPAFEKLKNPILRNTVAKIATVQQAAAIAKIPVEELVNLLRKEADQELEALDHNPSSYHLNFERPDWLEENKVVTTLDLAPLLAAGEHPVHQVVADLKKLHQGEIYQIQAPFLPAPLIDKASSLGFEHYVKEEKMGSVVVYFRG